MNPATPLSKFLTFRNPTDKKSTKNEFEIQPSTPLTNSLIEIIESDQEQSEKINAINLKLDGFIQSKSFFKTKQQLAEVLSKEGLNSDKAAGEKKVQPRPEDAERANHLYEVLYDNVLIRTLTKSNNQEIFKFLTNALKSLHLELNHDKVDQNDVEKLRILLPERLVLSFSPPKAPPEPAKPSEDIERAALFVQIKDLTDQKTLLEKSLADYESQIIRERQTASGQVELPVNFDPTSIQAGSGQAARTTPVQENTIKRNNEPNPALEQLEVTAQRLRESEREVSVKIGELNREAFQLFPEIKYAQIGDRWVDVTTTEDTPHQDTSPATVEGNSIVVYSQGCALKFPFQVADLRVVEQQSVGYVPADIAHINNTQQGELNEKITVRSRSVTAFESLISEDETFHETDTTSTDKHTVEKAASEIQSEETAFNVNASVSGTYGMVTAAVDGGYSNTQSAQNANSAAQTYARELVQRIVDRASSRVRKERSQTTVEKFKEKVRHLTDNTKSTDAKSIVYRWLSLLVKATLRNYGKCLFVQLDVAHLSHDYLTRAIKDKPILSLPPDPKGLDVDGERLFSIDKITRDNYLAWADLYHAKLEPAPEPTIIVSYVNSGKEGANSEKTLHPIPDGYCAVQAHVKRTLVGQSTVPGHQFAFISVLIGRNDIGDWIITPETPSITTKFDSRVLNGETKFLPISISSPFGGGFALNIEIECEFTAEGLRAWQTKCYNAILDAYDNLKAEVENKMSDFDPNMPGLNPSRKRDLIKSELKKGVLRKMFRCNPFWITDNYKVGAVYDPDCCKDTLNGEKIRFLETVFDWTNITYELHPYLYADKDNWTGLLDLTDDDPHFEAFLQASYATVHVPVFRDSLKERAAVNFIMNNSIANYEVVPASMQPLLDELENIEPAQFTTGLNGEDLLVPISVVDLGIFRVPTDLVILECGVENGVKPIGFPQTAAATTDVSIPKQYSPAIIADSCPTTTPPPIPITPPSAGTSDTKADPTVVPDPVSPSPVLIPALPAGPEGKKPKL